ncbi:hypothetical protein GYMLUDRAFT_160639, partial [Collybiopsis luxurians FD-317 M1]
FVVQLLTRWVQHLPITELEIMTVAFAVMNILIYFFWWEKPVGICCHICIQKEDSGTIVVSEHKGILDIQAMEPLTETAVSFDDQIVQILPKQRMHSFGAWLQITIVSFTAGNLQCPLGRKLKVL